MILTLDPHGAVDWHCVDKNTQTTMGLSKTFVAELDEVAVQKARGLVEAAQIY